MKNFKLWAAVYICGALLTNSYVREFRYDEWYQEIVSDKHQDRKSSAENASFLATVFWPIYGAVLVSDKIVHTVGHTNVKIEKPEILSR